MKNNILLLQEECQNDIMLIVPGKRKEEVMFCGTNSFKPLCRTYRSVKVRLYKYHFDGFDVVEKFVSMKPSANSDALNMILGKYGLERNKKVNIC